MSCNSTWFRPNFVASDARLRDITRARFRVLRRFLSDPRHRFIPDDLSSEDPILHTERILGANNVTDHYLAALARQRGFAVATFDIALSRAFQEEPALVELLS